MGKLTLRNPQPADAPAIWELVRESDVLDVNSCYAYLLLCRDFSETCIVASLAGRVAGFVTGYIPPQDPQVLFVWQVAVGPSVRRQGLAKRMILQLLRSPACDQVERLETTISPSNLASRRLFQSMAEELRAALESKPGFAESDFGDSGPHEEEERIVIGPLRQESRIHS